MQMAAIGCGRMGRWDMKSLIHSGEEYGAVMTAVCDVDRWRLLEGLRKAEETYAEMGVNHKVRMYDRYEDVLADSSIDAVTIATPDHVHAAVAIAAAKAGKAIYLQKPLTYTVREGQELVRAVRDNGVVLQTGTQQRSSIYFRRVCELVRNGKIGELRRIEVAIPMDNGTGETAEQSIPEELDYRRWLGTAPFTPYTEHRVHPRFAFSRPGWMQTSDYGHGMITNWGAHMLDIAQWGNGSDDSGPVEIEAEAVFEDRGAFDVHRAFRARIRYANGVELILETLPEEEEKEDGADEEEEKEKMKPGVRFVGTDGWARCERGGFEAHDRELLRWEPGEGDVQLYKSTNHYDDFLEAVRGKRDPITPVEVGHRSNTLCLLNLISARLGRGLRWDPVSETFPGNEEANRWLGDMRRVKVR